MALLVAGCTRANPAFGDDASGTASTSDAPATGTLDTGPPSMTTNASTSSGTSSGSTTAKTSGEATSSDPSSPGTNATGPTVGPVTDSQASDSMSTTGAVMTSETGTDGMALCDPDFPLCEPYPMECAPGATCSPWPGPTREEWSVWGCMETTPRGSGAPVQLGEVCFAACPGHDGPDSCDRGLVCNGGVCEMPCEDNGHCPFQYTCDTSGGSFGICLPAPVACEPILGDCPGEDSCTMFERTYGCADVGPMGAGEPCSGPAQCSENLACVRGQLLGLGGGSFCTPLCDPLSPGECGAFDCLSVFQQDGDYVFPVPDRPNWGVCLEAFM